MKLMHVAGKTHTISMRVRISVEGRYITLILSFTRCNLSHEVPMKQTGSSPVSFSNFRSSRNSIIAIGGGGGYGRGLVTILTMAPAKQQLQQRRRRHRCGDASKSLPRISSFPSRSPSPWPYCSPPVSRRAGSRRRRRRTTSARTTIPFRISSTPSSGHLRVRMSEQMERF